ncbi:MAG TPA: hypothetical protein VG889_09630 [Rhizomicrobium sp.]|nr:hypothetical protein [Rhizomicrobium sp.]
MAALAILSAAMLAAAPAGDASCIRALGPLASGSVPQPDGFERVACPKDASRPYRYDRAGGIARLTREVAAGEVLRPAPELDVAMVRPGDTLELTSGAGPVRIERDVTALQAARPGQRLFVRAADGQVLSVRYEDVAP